MRAARTAGGSESPRRPESAPGSSPGDLGGRTEPSGGRVLRTWLRADVQLWALGIRGAVRGEAGQAAPLHGPTGGV